MSLSVVPTTCMLKLLLVASLAISSTMAHITLSPKFGEPGQNLTTAFHVPHGCNGSSTTGILVTVPQNNVSSIVPQQVSNWTLHTTYTDNSNTTVKTIEWSGGLLKATDALDFPIVLSLPLVDLSKQANVTLNFPVHQTCEVGAADWNVTDGTKDGEPAPTLIIVKNATQAAADAIAIKHNTTTAAPSASSVGSASSSAITSAGSAGNTLSISYVALASFAVALVQAYAL